MNFSEIIKIGAEVVIAIFTVVLAYATYVLARHTKAMNMRLKEENRVRDIQRCIFLMESIIGIYPSEISLKTVNLLSELLTFSKYFHDSDTKRQFEQIVYQFQLAMVGDGIDFIDDTLKGSFGKIKPRLTQEIIEWQKDLGNYRDG